MKIRVAKCPNCGEIMAFYAHYKSKVCTRCGKKFLVANSIQLGLFENAYQASEFVKKAKMKEKYG
jgi:ribosomal protein S27AE